MLNVSQRFPKMFSPSSGGRGDGPETALSLEAKCLIRCIQHLAAVPKSEVEEGDVAGIDWSRFYDLVGRHGAWVAAYQGLRWIRNIPETARTLVQRTGMEATAYSMHTVRELFSILYRLEEDGISAIPIKGPVFAESVYGSPSLRCSIDLDIVVCIDDVDRTRNILRSYGYTSYDDNIHTKDLISKRKDSSFFREGPPRVELHWKLFDDFRGLQIPIPWEQLDTVSVGGRPVLSLPRDAYLVYLSVHGSSHAWCRLTWIADIAQLLRVMSGEEVAAAARIAKELRCERVFHLGVALAETLYDAPVQRWLHRAARSDRTVRSLEQRVIERQIEGEPLDRMEMALFHLQMRESIRDIAPYVNHLLELAATLSPAQEHSTFGRSALRLVARAWLSVVRGRTSLQGHRSDLEPVP